MLAINVLAISVMEKAPNKKMGKNQEKLENIALKEFSLSASNVFLLFTPCIKITPELMNHIQKLFSKKASEYK